MMRAALLGALIFFLWMFLAAAPLETLADSGGLQPADSASAIEAYRFAADWRHGMAGNSPLYMPGFFVLAIAASAWGRAGSFRRLAIEGGAMLAAGLVIAWLLADVAGHATAGAFERATAVRIVGPWPDPPLRAAFQGLYTAATWMAAVVAGCRALARRSLLPLLIVPPMTVVLALIRPWTVGDFTALWIARAADGDPIALTSAIAVPLAGWLLVRMERPAQRVQTHVSARRIEADE